MPVTIRPATAIDTPRMLEIFRAVIATGDTYVFAEATTDDDARDYWLGPNMASWVAARDGAVVGIYKLIPNRRDRGSHVANASFMVDPAWHGHGVGRSMGEHCLRQAKAAGYAAMQFNFVVSTKARGVALWKSLGFAIVGTSPKAFQHAQLGLVDAYVMHRSLEDIDA